jgi:hypothetical protein
MQVSQRTKSYFCNRYTIDGAGIRGINHGVNNIATYFYKKCGLKENKALKKFLKNCLVKQIEELNTKITFFLNNLSRKLKGTIAE